MKTTVGDIQAFLERKAPPSLAMEGDKIGLHVGAVDTVVDTVVVCLDLTPSVLTYAKEQGAQLIVTHHPVIYHPLTRLEPQGVPYQLAVAGIAAFSMHTNLDAAAGGVNDTLAARLGLTEVSVCKDGLARRGVLPTPLAPTAFAEHVAKVLGTAVRACEGERLVKKVALCGGAGGDMVLEETAADALLTGEFRHHEWLAAAANGQTAVDAGHYATEVVVVDTVAAWLTEEFSDMTVLPFTDKAPYETIG